MEEITDKKESEFTLHWNIVKGLLVGSVYTGALIVLVIGLIKFTSIIWKLLM